MNKEMLNKQQEEYEAMVRELNLITKAVHMVWKREQTKLIDQWLKEEDLKQ
jgi:hypothetical protein